MGAYKDLMFSQMGSLETAYRVPFKYLFYAYHPLTAPERLINGSKFPIFICFGDRDFLGTEGADKVVRSSAFYESGDSQLHVIPNAGHLPHIHNPQHLEQAMIGFFNGTLKGKFDQKAASDFTPRRSANPSPKL